MELPDDNRLDPSLISGLLAECAQAPAGQRVSGSHLSEGDIISFENGSLSDADTQRVDSHLASCVQCSARMEEFCQAMAPWQGSREQVAKAELLKRLDAGTTNAPLTMRLPRQEPKREFNWLLVTAAGLAAVFGLSSAYLLREKQEWTSRDRTSVETIARLERERQTLRPAPVLVSWRIDPVLRGESSSKRLDLPKSASGLIALDFRIGNDIQFASYRVLIDTDGTPVANIVTSARANATDQSVSIVIPAPETHDVRYRASVAGIENGGPETVIERYDFRITRPR